MRLVALGWCAVLAVGISHSANAAEPQNSALPPPIAVNDHDGGFIPRAGTDRGFTINPDGPMAVSALLACGLVLTPAPISPSAGAVS